MAWGYVSVWYFVLRIWILFGIWCLEFGACYLGRRACGLRLVASFPFNNFHYLWHEIFKNDRILIN
jgi:hypothetical protein